MRKQRNCSQLKEQERSPKITNNEAQLTSLLDYEFKKAVVKILTELRKTVDRNTDHCNKELEIIKMNQSKLDNSEGNREDGVRRGDHLSPHKYIRNTTTCGTTPTEHLLNAGRRHQTSQKARNGPRTLVGQKKK